VLSPVDVAELGAETRELTAEALFDRYSTYVAAVAHRLLARDEEVDDTVQEVFLVAVRSLEALRNPSAAKAWLAGITVRVAKRRLQKRRWFALLGQDVAMNYETIADPGATPEQQMLLGRVYQVLDTLPTNVRLAWTLRHIQGEPLAQVAVLCCCSVSTAKRWVTTGNRAFQEAFEE
jgi:RNA polymerase sigma-70 factor (ECF subfamily)